MICHMAGRWCYHHPVLGAMAQLVARLVRNEKVRGSNPLSSTSWAGFKTRPFLYVLRRLAGLLIKMLLAYFVLKKVSAAS